MHDYTNLVALKLKHQMEINQCGSLVKPLCSRCECGGVQGQSDGPRGQVRRQVCVAVLSLWEGALQQVQHCPARRPSHRRSPVLLSLLSQTV